MKELGLNTTLYLAKVSHKKFGFFGGGLRVSEVLITGVVLYNCNLNFFINCRHSLYVHVSGKGKLDGRAFGCVKNVSSRLGYF